MFKPCTKIYWEHEEDDVCVLCPDCKNEAKNWPCVTCNEGGFVVEVTDGVR